jgi:6-phosphogluconolactonase
MKMTRRLFASLVVAATLLISISSARSRESAAATKEFVAFVGTYTAKTDSKGIYSFRFDPQSGKLSEVNVAAQTSDPSFVTVSKDGKYLYAVNELSTFEGKKSGAVTSYSVDRNTGKLTQLNQVPSGGADPCYVSLDQTGKYVLVANYSGGSVAIFPIPADGRLGSASAFVQHTGSGPNKERQEGPHAHYIATSGDDHFVFAVDLGLDEVLIYRFDSSKGTLTHNDPPFVKLAGGAGPRHLAFHPNGKFAYVLNEINSTVTALSYNPQNASFSTLQSLSTIPKDFTTLNETAEIVVHPGGKFLYVSNRGHDSIAVFAIDPNNGTLKLAGDYPTQGKTPRNFVIDPTGNFLLAANQESNDIITFRIDRSTGALTSTGQVSNVPAPVDIVFLQNE